MLPINRASNIEGGEGGGGRWMVTTPLPFSGKRMRTEGKGKGYVNANVYT